jgi:membrane-associated protease RseP (regulator of RpoE activity)
MTDPARQAYRNHARETGHQASQDFDALVAKLGTAGLTVATAIAGLTDAAGWGFLIGSGLGFSLALTFSLLSIRLSADGLRALASGREYEQTWQFGWVRVLNWLAFFALSLAFMALAIHLFDATIREVAR